VYSEKAEFFKEKGFQKIYAEPGDKKHEDYLRQIGFVPAGSNNNVTSYCLVLN
jgi:hypothetical protein